MVLFGANQRVELTDKSDADQSHGTSNGATKVRGKLLLSDLIICCYDLVTFLHFNLGKP